jgi:hypothetical protein
MTSLIRLLRSLGLLGALDTAIPETVAFPIAQLERERRGERQRVRTSGDDPADKEAAPWRWGDEAEPTP